MSLTLDRSRVGAEWRGLARLYRDRVKAEDHLFERASRTIASALRERLRRHPRLRHEQVAGTLRNWRCGIPTTFRLGNLTTNLDRDHFEIAEPRLTGSVLLDTAWDGDGVEPGVAVMNYRLRLEGGKLKTHWQAVALISLHALARRIERGEDRAHEAITADLSVLLDADPEVNEVPASDGYWIGAVRKMRGKDGISRVRSVRTWHQ
jgi:hypothetical protein